MTEKMESFEVESGLYPWGKAVLTENWVVLHQKGDPKLAISYKEKVTAMKIARKVLGLRKTKLRNY
jgi:hypothetical protein